MIVHRSSLLRSLLAGAVLLLNTGCAMVDPVLAGLTGSGARVQTVVDPNAPYVVVTVGGLTAATPTPQGVAPTIPDSTPLPRLEPPANSQPPTPRPAASPSLNRGGASAAAQAVRPPDAAIPTTSPAAIPGSP